MNSHYDKHKYNLFIWQINSVKGVTAIPFTLPAAISTEHHDFAVVLCFMQIIFVVIIKSIQEYKQRSTTLHKHDTVLSF